AGDLAALGGVGGRHRALDRIEAAALDLHVVVLAADVEVTVAGLDALGLAFAEVVATLDEQVLGVGIRQRTGGVHADPAAVAVIGDAAVDVGGADQDVCRVAAIGVGHAELVLRAVFLELAADAGTHCGLVTVLVRDPGQVVDHATGTADALGRRRAIDHLDPADHAHVGEGAIATALAQRRALRHAVEQAQRDPASQGFARVAHCLRGFGIAGHHACQHRGGVLGDVEVALHLLGRDHADRTRDLVDRGRHAGTGDDDVVEPGAFLVAGFDLRILRGLGAGEAADASASAELSGLRLGCTSIGRPGAWVAAVVAVLVKGARCVRPPTVGGRVLSSARTTGLRDIAAKRRRRPAANEPARPMFRS